MTAHPVMAGSPRLTDDAEAPVDNRLVPALQVEVFPIEATRWIAVIEAPDGPFSTEATSPDLIAGEVARVIREVLGSDLEHELLDEDGQPWGEGVALEQLGRL